jgi:hypothetical protein
MRAYCKVYHSQWIQEAPPVFLNNDLGWQTVPNLGEHDDENGIVILFNKEEDNSWFDDEQGTSMLQPITEGSLPASSDLSAAEWQCTGWQVALQAPATTSP